MQHIPFIDLFKSFLRVSGDKLAHPQEHFLTENTVKKCSWDWASLSPETCRADLKNQQTEFVASCSLLKSLYKYIMDLKPSTTRRYTCCKNVLKSYHVLRAIFWNLVNFIHSNNIFFFCEFVLIHKITSTSTLARSNTGDEIHERICARIIWAELRKSS